MATIYDPVSGKFVKEGALEKASAQPAPAAPKKSEGMSDKILKKQQAEDQAKEAEAKKMDGTKKPIVQQGQKQGDVLIPFQRGALNQQAPAQQPLTGQTVGGQEKKSNQTEIPSDVAAQKETKAVPVSDPSTDPAKTIATMTTNLSTGKGNHTGVETDDPPPVLTDAQIFGEMLNTEGKQVTLRDIEDPSWYEDDSFYEGLMSFGLNLLSGNDWAESFNAGAEVFQKSKALEKRQVWAQDLLSQGFDAHEVQKWIETGDNDELTDPEEKKAKAIQMALSQQQLANAVRQGDPRMLDYYNKQAAQDRARKMDMEDKQWALQQQIGYSQIESNKASAAKTREDIKRSKDPIANWRGSGPDGRALVATEMDSQGRTRTVIESPYGWLDFTTREKVDIGRPGTQILEVGVGKEEAKRYDTQRKEYDTAMEGSSTLAQNIDKALGQMDAYMTADMWAINPLQYAPWHTDSSAYKEIMDSARSGLAITDYGNTKGIGGASATMEESIKTSIPSINATPYAKRDWAIRRGEYDLYMVEENIKDQRRRYGDGGVNPALIQIHNKLTQKLLELRIAQANNYQPGQQ